MSEKIYTEKELDIEIKKALEENYIKNLIDDFGLIVTKFIFSPIKKYGNQKISDTMGANINQLLNLMEDKSQISDGYHTFAELYDYRRAYNAMLVNEYAKQGLYNVHKSWKHNDGQECFGGGWFVVQMDLPTGQISNHYEAKYWNEFKCEEREVSDTWDGHTPQEALERMVKFLNP